MTVESFMADYLAHTTPHPVHHSKRFYLGVVSLDVSISRGHIHLSEIVALDKRRGYGGAALRFLCDLADKHQVTIAGRAIPIPKTGGGRALGKDNLLAWYARHGFTVTGSGAIHFILRKPK